MHNLQRRRAALLLAGAAILFGGFLAACGGGGSSSPATPPAATTTNVSLSDPATCAGPNGPYSHVYVTITDVQASTDGTNFTDITPSLKSAPKQVDLLGQANNQCFLAMLGSTTELQPGNYQQIRMILQDNSAASVVANNQCGGNAANCVVLNDGSVHTLQLSSEAKTGIKIPSGQLAGGAFTVAAGATKDLNIDFNTCSSIVVQGNGQYRLKPVLHAGEVSTTSTSINGTVVDKATGKAVTGGNVMVALEQKDSNGIDRVVMAASADSNGNFVFCPVPAGSYDVVAAGIDGNNTAYAATVTTNVANGNTVTAIPLVAETGASTAPGAVTGQVTTSTGSAGTAADISLSALQTVAAGGGNLTFTMPLVQQASATASLATAAGASCPVNTDCANYTLSLPAAATSVGAFSSSGTSWSVPSGAASSYSVEAQAFQPSSGGTADCSPATIATGSNALLAVTPGVSVTASVLSFTGCQ